MKTNVLERLWVFLFLILPAGAGAQGAARDYKLMAEPGTGTSVALVITDEENRIIRGAYMFELQDTTTRKSKYSYAYDIATDGQATRKPVPAGVYDFIDVRSERPFLRAVAIKADNLNTVSVKVANGKLRFQYEDGPTDTVLGLQAKVIPLYADGDTILQGCNVEVRYLPGEYFVEVNTLPVTRFRTEVDWAATTIIELTRQGTLQLLNTDSASLVSLFHPVRNKFEKFYELPLTTVTDPPALQLKAGAYEAHWLAGTGTGKEKEKVKKFNVQPGELLKLNLD
jgi:hypothetical protein